MTRRGGVRGAGWRRTEMVRARVTVSLQGLGRWGGGGGGWGGGGSACRRPECAWCAGGGSVGNGVDLSCSGVGVVGGVRAPLLAGWQCWLRAGWRRGRWWLQCASYAYRCNYHRLHLLACVVGVGVGVRARSRACRGPAAVVGPGRGVRPSHERPDVCSDAWWFSCCGAGGECGDVYW